LLCLDWIFLDFYESLKNLIKGRNQLAISRGLFIAWVVIVVVFFVKEFVVSKILG